MNHSIPFHFVTESGAEVWIFHMLRFEHLHGLSGLYRVLVAIEAILIIIHSLFTSYLIYHAFRFPPVHLNLVIITLYSISMLVVSSLGRVGQILYESGLIGERGLASTPLLIFSQLRLAGLAMVARYGMAIYCERCLALRFVRDYERNRRLYIGVIYIIQDIIISNFIAWILSYEYLPGYPCFLLSIFLHAGCFCLIKHLLSENQKRLERLNNRNIRRPTIESRTGALPRKFFGDSSKDMYTLSLRLQLDENIWCCKQLTRGNDVIMYAFALVVAIFAVPPLFSYTEDTEWILNLFVMLANFSVPVSAITVGLLISWSLDKLRPIVFPSFLINWITARNRKISSLIPLVAQNRLEEQADNYFDQLSQQWDRGYDIVNCENG